MLEKPEVWGVQDISGSQAVMRMAAKTLPLRQWEVARELRERVKSALDAGPPAPVEAEPSRTRQARKTAARFNGGPGVQVTEGPPGSAPGPVEPEEDMTEHGPPSAP